MNNMHALIVDDDKQALDTMGMILEMDDFFVSKTENGQQALDCLTGYENTENTVDFLVLDLEMDTLSGIELLTELRKRGNMIPVMVVTGFASRKNVINLLRQGVFDFLDKPIRMEEFRSHVHRLANEVLNRRKEIAVLPVVTQHRAVSVFDLGNLGFPYTLRRRIDVTSGNHLILANRKRSGYDILLVEAFGADSECFYMTMLIKNYFDKNRTLDTAPQNFLQGLNQVILDGSLKCREVRALLIHLGNAGILEVLPAGYPTRMFFGLGKDQPRFLTFSGLPLGGQATVGQIKFEIPYKPNDKLFVFAENKIASNGEKSLDDTEEFLMAESVLGQGHDSLDEMTDSMWQRIHKEIKNAKVSDGFLLGLTLP